MQPKLTTAVEAAAAAFPEWRRTPPEDRIQPLFKLKMLLEEHIDDIARIITMENGKTFTEAKAEMRRAIENVEVACGIPMMMQGYNLEDVARGIDEMMIRQPLGVTAAIVPFNFPGMIAFWYLPYAIATGNTFILKPSERVPLTMRYVYELLAKDGSAQRCGESRQRRQGCSRRADRPPESARDQLRRIDAGCALHLRALGRAREALPVSGWSEESRHRAARRRHADGDADHQRQRLRMRRATLSRGLGCGHDWRSAEDISRLDRRRGLETPGRQWTRGRRADGARDHAAKQRARRIVDWPRREARRQSSARWPQLEDSEIRIGQLREAHDSRRRSATSDLADTEIFGPVLSLVHADNLDEALAFLERSAYGNQASLFTSSGSAARRFRYEAPAGNIGINIGVAAPMAYFPFSGWKNSFFGDLHGQGRDAIEFYTDKKVVVERWAKEHSRKF